MYAMEGRRAESLRALRKTIDLWVDVGARSNVVYSLGHAAHGMWLLGENEFAATLAGVVQSGRIALRIVAGPDGRRHDEAIAGLKAVLGHDAFEAAIRHGAAMSYEDVIRFVRDETERRLREESDR
jgi:hypothetical protein